MTPDTGSSTDARGPTPLRVLSLWFALSFTVGAVVLLALEPVLGRRERTLAAHAIALGTAVFALHVRPGLDTHVAWRVAYGFVLGAGVVFGGEMLSVIVGDLPGLAVIATQHVATPTVAIPLGIGVAALVEWHRQNRQNRQESDASESDASESRD